MTDSIQSNAGPKCPDCGHVHDVGEDWDDVVTYWGDYITEYECTDCNEKFTVEEIVSRVWKSTPGWLNPIM